MIWQMPPWGDHFVAVPTSYDFAATCDAVEAFFSRSLARYNHPLHHEGQSYAVFSFLCREDAALCMTQFAGEPFDPRDKGRGKNWPKWYRGRAAKREKNRSPYDFGRRPR